MVLGQTAIRQQLTCFFHSSVQLIIRVVSVELVERLGIVAVGDTVVCHVDSIGAVVGCGSLGSVCEIHDYAGLDNVYQFPGASV